MRCVSRSALTLGLLMAALNSWAGGVYRHVDASGHVTYTDRPAGENSAPVKMREPVNPSRYEYESARIRAESDRVYSQRLEAEDRQHRPVVIYDPQGLQRPPPRPTRAPGVTIRRDPNLPDAPAPTLEPQYHYHGR